MNVRGKIAVIGSGVAGIVASHLLQRKFEIELFEKQDRLGGHTNTIVVDRGPDEGLAIDTGFIVCNDKTYPHFLEFLRQLKIPTRKSDMSFGFYDEVTDLQYAGTDLLGLFAQPSNLFNAEFLKLIFEILRFGRQGMTDLEEDLKTEEALGTYLERNRFKPYFIRNYLIPMGSAIWSTSRKEMLDFPAVTLLQFFKNHGLLTLQDRPQWMTVEGGSHSYLKAFSKTFKGTVHLKSKITRLERKANEVVIHSADAAPKIFDYVVIATHADEARNLLGDEATQDEALLLGSWTYQKNRTILHTDSSVLPPNRRAWASWNYVREKTVSPDGPCSMTYHMNRLQGLRSTKNYCVTLNRAALIDQSSILKEIDYTHPTYDLKSLASQHQLSRLQGNRRTYFCGSYFGYGFHEDAVRSSVQLASHWGISW